MPVTVPCHRPKRAFDACLIGAAVLLLGGCSAPDQPAKGPPEVGFTLASPTQAPLVVELPGRVSALRTAQVRPQVAGVIQRQLFTEGALVHQGQPLYRIDSSLFRAAQGQATANLQAAEASADAARQKAERYRPLAADQAVAQQDYTDAAALARQTAAQVAQARAALRAATVNLRYTTVPAPISGRIGRSLVTEGALATANQIDPLAVISVLDRVNVDIQQSAADLLALRRKLANGGATGLSAPVRLRLDDGSDYAQPGTLEFSEVTADAATGSVTLRARFANPQQLLLPGMFVRAVLTQAQQTAVFLVPQSALTRDPRGAALLWLVGPGNKAELRKVTADRTLGDNWVVSDGLKPGDKVITQGLGRVTKPGQPLNPLAATTPQRPRGVGNGKRGG